MCCQDIMQACNHFFKHVRHLQLNDRGGGMSIHGPGVRRVLAISAGVAAIAAGAALNVTHLVEGGQTLVSPMIGAVIALALGAVAAALVASEAWRSGRKILASCLVVSVVAGEGF